MLKPETKKSPPHLRSKRIKLSETISLSENAVDPVTFPAQVQPFEIDSEETSIIVTQPKRSSLSCKLLACIILVCTLLAFGLLYMYLHVVKGDVSTAKVRTQIEGNSETITLGEYEVCNWKKIDFADSPIPINVNGQENGFYEPKEDLLVEGFLCDTNEAVILAIDDEGLHGSVHMEGRTEFVLVATSSEKSHIEQVERPLPKESEDSKEIASKESKIKKILLSHHSRRSMQQIQPGSVNVNIHLEIDSYMVDTFDGNEYAAARYGVELVAIINHDLFYDIGFNVRVVSLNVRTTPISNTINSNAYLEALATIPRPGNANLVHGLTTAAIGGGVAYMWGLYYASQNCYGVSGINGQFSQWDYQHLAHELGHNFGAPHTHEMDPQVDTCGTNCYNKDIGFVGGPAQSGTIMSYCHLCDGSQSNVRHEWHDRVKEEIWGAYNLYAGQYLQPTYGCLWLSTDAPDMGVEFYFLGVSAYGDSMCLSLESMATPNGCQVDSQWVYGGNGQIRAAKAENKCWTAPSDCSTISLGTCQHSSGPWSFNGNSILHSLCGEVKFSQDGKISFSSSSNGVVNGWCNVAEEPVAVSCGDTIQGSDISAWREKWFKFAPTHERVTISTCGSDFDTMLTVESTTEVVAEGDDNGNCGQQTVLENLFLAPFDGDENYIIKLAGFDVFGNDFGHWELHITCGDLSSDPAVEAVDAYVPTIHENEVLVWSDEFNNCPGGLPDEDNWGYEIGHGIRNDEDAYYSGPCQDFRFVHDGHCASGWIDNSHQDSLQKCRDHCAANPDAGYFAFAQPNTCGCYRQDTNCPDDDEYADHNSYRILRDSCANTGNPNAFCESGNLVIEARRESPREEIEHAEYTSALIRTDLGREPKYFGYGRYVIRAKIPTSSGAWPAIWTLGENMRDIGWPRSGEIDIMEYYTGNTLANVMHSNQVGGAVWDSTSTPLPDNEWANQFHVWEMEWSYGKIVLKLDGEEVNSYDTKRADGHGHPNPYHQHHFLLLNLAIGGNRGGDPTLGNYPMRYEVDYVRFYEKSTCGAVSGQCNGEVRWAHESGKHSNPEWYDEFEDITGVPLSQGTQNDMQLYMFCQAFDNADCGENLVPPCTCSFPPCECPIRPKPKQKACNVLDGRNLFDDPDDIPGEGRTVTPDAQTCAERCENTEGCIGSTWWHDGGCHLSDSGSVVSATWQYTTVSECHSCSSMTDYICVQEISWASQDGKTNFPQHYENFEDVIGVPLARATFGDMQKYFYCTQHLPGQCSVPIPAPCDCSSPPCNVCSNIVEYIPPTFAPTLKPTIEPTDPPTRQPTESPTEPTCGVIEPECLGEVSWAANFGAPDNPQWYNHFMEYTGVHISGATEEDMWTYFICSNYNPYKCSNSMLPCNRACVSCDYSHMTDSCYGTIDWAQKVGIRWYSQWYPDFQYITGQFPWQASFSDMQRYYKCKGYHAESWRCGGLEFPCTCSHPPCNTCSV